MLVKWWAKWLVDRKLGWNNLIKDKQSCHPFVSLGDALANKTIFPTLRGIISIKNDKGFNLAMSLNQYQWDIRDGHSALFWEDCVVGKLSFKFSRLYRLYSLSKLKLLSVRDYCDIWLNPEAEVSTHCNRQLRAWELEMWYI